MKFYCKDDTIEVMCNEQVKHLSIDRTYLDKFIGGEVKRVENEAGEMIGLKVVPK